MKHIKSIIIVLLLTLTFTFPAGATETYRKTYSKSDRKGYVVGGTNSAAKRTAKQLKHHNYTNKIQ